MQSILNGYLALYFNGRLKHYEKIKQDFENSSHEFYRPNKSGEKCIFHRKILILDWY